MKIDVARLNENGEDFEGEISADILNTSKDDQVRPDSPIHYKIHAILINDELIITGNLNINTLFRCSSCSEEFPRNISVKAFNYVHNIAGNDENDEFLEGETSKYDKISESIDLTKDIRESILLAFPANPVCNSECAGLCPQCGINKNKETCDCKPPSDNRWDLLDNLKV
jgi:uncharacterized protein